MSEGGFYSGMDDQVTYEQPHRSSLTVYSSVQGSIALSHIWNSISIIT